MKYLFFTASIIGIIPAVFLLLCYRRWTRWCALALVGLQIVFEKTSITFFAHDDYRGTSRGLEISLIYIVATIIMVTFLVRCKRMKLFPDKGAWIYFAYGLWSWLSEINSASDMYCVFELWKMAMMYLVFLAVFNYLEFSKGDFNIFVYGLAFVIIFNFLDIVYQHFTGVFQVYGIFPHQNSMAMWMMMVGTLFLARSMNGRDKFMTFFHFGVFLLASVTLFRSYSRGAIFCYPVSCALTLFFSYTSPISAKKLVFTAFLIGAVLLLTMIFLPNIIERFEKAPKSSLDTRKNLATAAMNMIRDKPIIGVGLNNWGLKINPPWKYSQHRESRRGFTEDSKDGIVETIYLLVAAECGVPCLIILLTWFGYYWFTTFHLMSVMRKSKYFYIPAGFFGGLTGVMLQSVLEWVLKQQMNFLLLMIYFAIISFTKRHLKYLLSNGPTQAEDENKTISELESEPLPQSAEAS